MWVNCCSLYFACARMCVNSFLYYIYQNVKRLFPSLCLPCFSCNLQQCFFFLFLILRESRSTAILPTWQAQSSYFSPAQPSMLSTVAAMQATNWLCRNLWFSQRVSISPSVACTHHEYYNVTVEKLIFPYTWFRTWLLLKI